MSSAITVYVPKIGRIKANSKQTPNRTAVVLYMLTSMYFVDDVHDCKNQSFYLNSVNANSTVQNCSMTVYSLYPSGILLFGAVCCILISIAGTIGNLISILAMVKCKRLRNSTTAFIVNLCVSDMLFCGFTMPFTALIFLNRNWYYGDMLCKMFALIKFSNGLVSVFTVVAIAVNRYILIIYPRSYEKIYGKRNTLILIVSLWLFPFLLILLPFFNAWGTLEFDPKIGDCGVMNLNGKSPRTLIFVLGMVFPIILFVACYLKIYFAVKTSDNIMQHENQVKQQDKKKYDQHGNHNVKSSNVYIINNQIYGKSTVYTDLRNKKVFRVFRIALVIFIFYIISTFPIGFIKLLRKEGDLPVMNVLAYVFYFSSSFVNPVIYIAMSKEYRTAYKDLFLSHIC